MSIAALPTPGFDLDAILAPIPGNLPAGRNLRDIMNSTYATLQARMVQADNASFRRTLSTKEAKEKFWSEEVIVPGLRALREESKDLDIAAWVARGLVQTQGALGLYVGLRLIEGLHQRYWTNLYSEPPDSGIEPLGLEVQEHRRSILSGLDEELAKGLNVFEFLPAATPGKPLHFRSFQNAKEQKAKNENDSQAFDDYQTAVAANRRSRFESALGYLREAKALLDRAAVEIAARYDILAKKKNAPYFSMLEPVLVSVIAYLEELLPWAQPDPVSAPQTPSSPAEAGSPSSSLTGTAVRVEVASPSVTVIYTPRDRADALDMLRDVAVYLQKQEPLSPVPYLLCRAIHWGQMPTLKEWIEELLSEKSTEADPLRLVFGSSAFESPNSNGKYAPKSRADAFQRLSDIAVFLQINEPLSPLPALIQKAIRWGCRLSHDGWLAEVLGKDPALLALSRTILGIVPKAEPSGLAK